MKKYITPLLLTGCTFLLIQRTNAQTDKAATKPAASNQAKPAQQNAVPPAAPKAQNKIEPQNYKPVVPGGEFKPEAAKGMVPSTASAVKQETYAEHKPASPALPVNSLVAPAPEKQVKKADPVPALQKKQ